ncbi:MAG: Membrane protein [uncultured bacterium]|nr:MAG: Membrane protein [uncultured bacterium]
MYLDSIYYGILAFLAILAVHVLVWRMIKPKNHMSAIFTIFIIIPFFALIGLLVFSIQGKLLSIPELLSTSLLYFAIACAYIQTYPPAQANAPSLQIIYLISKFGAKGITEKEVMSIFNMGNLVQDRIDDLVIEGFVHKENGKLYLKSKGKVLSTIFYFYRNLYGLKQGEG